MTGPIWRVRELDIRYKSVRLPMPVSGVSDDMRGPHDAARLAAAVLADATVEKVIALHVNTKHRLIGVHVVSVGTLNAGLILAHNHPSGDPTPSPDDRALVSRLLQAGELLGVELLDALIVVDPSEGGSYYSFKEAGALR